MNINDRIYTTLADIMGLSLFSALKEHPLLGTLRELLDDLSEEKDEDPMYGLSDTYLEIAEDWAVFINVFVQTQWDYSFYTTLGYLTAGDDNPYTYAAENQENPPTVLCALAKTDLSRLGRIASFEIHRLGFHIAEILRKNGLDQIAGNIEEESRVLWAAEGKKSQGEHSGLILKLFPEKSNWGASLPALTEYLRVKGAGVLGQYSFFTWANESFIPDFPRRRVLADFSVEGGGSPPLLFSLLPVRNPDPVTIADFFGYEDQRSVVTANTLRFLKGKNANNLLLYGDRGTGKSATIKAVCNEYADRGLKLIEIDKSDMVELSDILKTLADRRSRRFIVFIDDLSFESADDSFLNLKALLEGGVESRPSNVVIYATSNRRHLVKEHLADRPAAAGSASAGDVRAFDTMQEQLSLADRFGITVVFTSPGQEEYLRIAEHIACRRGVLPDPLPPIEGELRTRFRENALRWEKWFNGRSPRTAVQYVDWLAGEDGRAIEGIRFPWE
jgi:predicted AAA+ superfamily ATPase